MNQLLMIFSKHMQTVFASLAVIMTINLGLVISSNASHAGTQMARSSLKSDMRGTLIPVVSIAYTDPANEPKSSSILMLASPGQAYVFSEPGAQMQIHIESATQICAQRLVQTDLQGVAEIPIAATRNCPQPRLVISH